MTEQAQPEQAPTTGPPLTGAELLAWMETRRKNALDRAAEGKARQDAETNN